jgi:hypothetical protein
VEIFSTAVAVSGTLLGRAGDVPRRATGRGCVMATIQPSALPWTKFLVGHAQPHEGFNRSSLCFP